MPVAHKQFHFVYKTSHPAGYYYIGKHSTNDLNDGYLGSGKKLAQYFKKYPVVEWTRSIIACFDTANDALDFEKLLVTEQEINKQNCLNLSLGGRGVALLEVSKETRLKHSVNGKKNVNALNALRTFERTTEYLAKVGATRKGIKRPPEVIAKMLKTKEERGTAVSGTHNSWKTRRERAALGAYK